MSADYLEVEGDCLYEARRQLKASLPADRCILKEQVVWSGGSGTVVGNGFTSQEAWEDALREVPPRAFQTTKLDEIAPRWDYVEVRAPDEAAARQIVERQSYAPEKRVTKVTLQDDKSLKAAIESRRHGRRYLVQVTGKATVRVKFERKATIRAELGDRDEELAALLRRWEGYEFHSDSRASVKRLIDLGADEKMRRRAALTILKDMRKPRKNPIGPDGEVYPSRSPWDTTCLAMLDAEVAIDYVTKLSRLDYTASLVLGHLKPAVAVDFLLKAALDRRDEVYLGDPLPYSLSAAAAVLALRMIGDERAREALRKIPKETIEEWKSDRLLDYFKEVLGALWYEGSLPVEIQTLVDRTWSNSPRHHHVVGGCYLSDEGALVLMADCTRDYSVLGLYQAIHG